MKELSFWEVAMIAWWVAQLLLTLVLLFTTVYVMIRDAHIVKYSLIHHIDIHTVNRRTISKLFLRDNRITFVTSLLCVYVSDVFQPIGQVLMILGYIVFVGYTLPDQVKALKKMYILEMKILN